MVSSQNNSNTPFDVIVIGAGPGGYVAAIRAAQNGLRIALVEEENLGGVCLNWGCIPTKALLRTSELYHTFCQSDVFGITTEKPKVNFAKVIERSRGVAKQLTQGIQHLMKKNKVTVVKGRGMLSGKQGDAHRITVTNEKEETQDLLAQNVILATGARPRTLPNLKPDGKRIWTSKEAMIAEEMPETLLVVGSGAIGVEFASFYAALGTKVTIVEIQDRILPVEDQEISTLARKQFENKGIKIWTNAAVQELKDTGGTLEAIIKTPSGEERHSFDRAIVAVGVIGNTEGLGLEQTRVKTIKNQIEVNEWCQTHEPGIYAIGDVAGAPWLAHKASHEGVMVADKIAGLPTHPLKKHHVPGCTYSHPQIASIGLTEAAAKAQGLEVKIGRFPFIGNGKAIALGEPEGLMKTIFDAKTGELLGAHLIGAEVTEMIQGFAIAMTAELTEAELMATIFPHPTLSEMMHESTLDAYGKAIHF
jgi:dihydrolipoamide dehydrogenase